MKVMLLILAALALSVTPTLAQDHPIISVSWDDITFPVDASFATNVYVTEIPAPTAQNGVGSLDEPHRRITLMKAETRRGAQKLAAVLDIYETRDLTPRASLSAQIDRLAALLQTTATGDLSALHDAERSGTLPYPLTKPDMVLIASRAHRVKARGIDGIAYISASTTADQPFLDQSIAYRFQGLSEDRLIYVVVTVPLSAALFDTDADAASLDASWDAYVQQATRTLDSSSLRVYQPAPYDIEAMVQQISVPQG